MELRPAPASQTMLSGQWQLVTPQRQILMQQLTAELQQQATRQMQRDQKRRDHDRPFDAEQNTDGAAAMPAKPPSSGINNWLAREQQTLQQALLNAVLPAQLLQITQQASRIELVAEGAPVRRFDVGIGSILVTSYAELTVESGWQGNTFVVHSQDGSQGIEIVERYRRTGDGQLELQLELEMPDLKQRVIVANYQLSR